MPGEFAIIGGSGAHEVLADQASRFRRLGPTPTPFGLSASLYEVSVEGKRLLFMPRHGASQYEVAAPWVNYRANIYALKERGVTRIMAWSGPGALDETLEVGQYVLPNDLIDQTRGRESSFFTGTGLGFIRQHPVFCPELRQAAEKALAGLNMGWRPEAVYVCTQGPRLETPAEIRAYRAWGGHLVGMTLAPECFLARELEMCYLPVCYVTNYAEGVRPREPRPGELFEGLLDEQERLAVGRAVARFLDLAGAMLAQTPTDRRCPCARAMERYRRAGRVGDDWRAWVGKL